MAITITQEIPPQYEVELLCIDIVVALELAAQGDHGVSLSGEVQNSPGHAPVTPAQGDLPSQRSWTGWSLKISSNPKVSVIV